MPLARGCSRETERTNFRKLYAENKRLPPGKRRSRAQITAIVLSNARKTGRGACRPPPNPNRTASASHSGTARWRPSPPPPPPPPNRANGRMRPTPAAIGKRYALAQLESTTFQDWMYDQLAATGPDLIDEPTKDNARRIARNMLQDLRHEITRNVTDRDVERELAQAGARHDREAVRAWGRGMHGAFDKSVPWLADEVLYQLRQKRKKRGRK